MEDIFVAASDYKYLRLAESLANCYNRERSTAPFQPL
jgi:hypothetical protein